MNPWTVDIGTSGFDLVNTHTGAREFHGPARFMAQAEADARNAQEVVVMGDDAAHFAMFLELGDEPDTTFGGQRTPRSGMLGRALVAPRFAA